MKAQIKRLASIVVVTPLKMPFKAPGLSLVGAASAGIGIVAAQNAWDSLKAAEEVPPVSGSGLVAQELKDNADFYALGGAAASLVATLLFVAAYKKTKRYLGVSQQLAR